MKLKIFCIFFLFPLLASAQGEANNWYFGHFAGVNFNTSPPTALINGQLKTNEGCSSISDENGNLLFYTDGRTVWNRNHQIMSNADYFNNTGLLGDPSSTSSGLIVPNPIDPSIYYVFTVDEPHHDNAATYPNQGPGTADGQYTDATPQSPQSVPQEDDGYNNGLTFSVVDMSLNNGLGDVIPAERNQPLVTYDPNDSEEIKYKCSEKVTAVKGSDCDSFWLITHFTDKFYAFQIDADGVDTNPVISEVGPTVSIDDYRRSAIGYLKASPDGKKLIIAHQTRTYNQIGTAQGDDGGVFLYDFDDATGEVSNNVALKENINPYGVEFSAQTKKAYATANVGNLLKLYQWDLESNDIPGSVTEISGVTGNTATALQLAPNGKIYRAVINNSLLGVINNPELDGNAVDYSENSSNGAIRLAGQTATFGLPPFIQSIFSSQINIVDESEEVKTQVKLCEGDTYILSYDDVQGATYEWYKNGNLLPTETSSSLDIQPSATQNVPYQNDYRLILDLNDGSCPFRGIASIYYAENPTAENASLTQCTYDSPETSLFDLTNANAAITNGNDLLEVTYYPNLSDAEEENEAITNPQNFENTSNPQILIAKVVQPKTGCEAYSQLTLNVGELNLSGISLSTCANNAAGFENFDLTEAKTQLEALDPNYSVHFYTEIVDAIQQENGIPQVQNFQNTTAFQQDIYARVNNQGNCASIVTINLEVEPYIPLGEDETVTYCLEDFPKRIKLSSGISSAENQHYSYFWVETEETTSPIEVNEPGNYTIVVTDENTGCTNQKKITVKPSNLASFTVEIRDFSEHNQAIIHLSDESVGDYVYALDAPNSFQKTPNFENIKPGKHTIYVKDKNGCGSVSKEIFVLGIMKFFTPNNDGFNDRWGLLGKNVENTQGAIINVFDRFGKLLFTFAGSQPGWDGTYHGKKMPANDYWYLVKMPDGRIFRGNFSLIY